jgi:hypothetical protein
MPSHDAEEFGAEKYNEFIALSETSWSHWLTSLERLTPEQINEPGTCGTWSVKDLIGHVAIWDDVAIDKIRAMLEDSMPTSPAETLDEFNDRTWRAFRDQSIDELLAHMHKTHDRLLGAFESASRSSNDILERIEWAIADDTWKHYDEHRQQIVNRFGLLP